MICEVGISGLRRGSSLARVFERMPDCRVCAACDPDPSARASFAARFPDARLFSEYEEMLGADLDVVVVASPFPLHCRQSLAALDAGCHVLQEVPLGQTLEECRSLLDAVRAHPGQRFMLAENCCYWAHILSWKELWRQGMVGDLIYAEAEYVHDVRVLMHSDAGPTWRDTLPPIHYCTHSLGPLLQITGERCVTACGLAAPSKIDPGPGRFDAEVGIFQTESGAAVKILAAFRVAREPSFHYYSLYGTRGCLETTRPPAAFRTSAYLEQVPHLQNMMELPLGLDIPRAPAGAAAGGHGTAEFYMVQDFLRSIREDLPSPIGIQAALEMSVPGLCAHQSVLEGGRPVPLPGWCRSGTETE